MSNVRYTCHLHAKMFKILKFPFCTKKMNYIQNLWKQNTFFFPQGEVSESDHKLGMYFYRNLFKLYWYKGKTKAFNFTISTWENKKYNFFTLYLL